MYSRRQLEDFRSSSRARAVTERRLPARDCTKEEKINCNGECEWVKDWWNPFSAGSCQFKEQKKVIYDSYCSDSSDPADLINLLVKIKASNKKKYRQKLETMSKSQLCTKLDKYLESLADDDGAFDNTVFHSWGVTKRNFIEAFQAAMIEFPKKNIMGTINFIAGYFKQCKWLRVSAYIIATAFVFYFILPWEYQSRLDDNFNLLAHKISQTIEFFSSPEEDYPSGYILNPDVPDVWSSAMYKYFQQTDFLLRYDGYPFRNAYEYINVDIDFTQAWKFFDTTDTFISSKEMVKNQVHMIASRENLISLFDKIKNEAAIRVGFLPAYIIRGIDWEFMLSTGTDADISFLARMLKNHCQWVTYIDTFEVDATTGVANVLNTLKPFNDDDSQYYDEKVRIILEAVKHIVTH